MTIENAIHKRIRTLKMIKPMAKNKLKVDLVLDKLFLQLHKIRQKDSFSKDNA